MKGCSKEQPFFIGICLKVFLFHLHLKTDGNIFTRGI